MGKSHCFGKAQIYWGDASDGIQGALPEFWEQNQMATQVIKKQMGARQLVLLKQVHGTEGHVINPSDRDLILFEQEGDYLIADLPGVVIGVLTADCVPLVIVDKNSTVVAVVHAGWRGSVAGIVREVVGRLQREFGIAPVDLCCWFGPCARTCCYIVGEEMYQQCRALGVDERFFVRKNSDLIFDLVGFNANELEKVGVPKEQIDTRNALCTICHAQFCSYRREMHPENPVGLSRVGGRNPTFVQLCH